MDDIEFRASQLVGKAILPIQRRSVGEVQSADPGAGVWTVLADEITDVAHESQLSASIRYVAKANVDSKSLTTVYEQFLEFVNPSCLSCFSDESWCAEQTEQAHACLL